MSVICAATIADHLDILIMQPDEEPTVVRDLMFAVLAFNSHGRGAKLQISFPLYADPKVTGRRVLGPCVRITGPAEKLYVLTLRHEVSSHLRSGRAMTLVRERAAIDAGRHERFDLIWARGDVSGARPILLSGQSRLIDTAGCLGIAVTDEAVFVARAESRDATQGAVDLLGFSHQQTVPVIA